MFNNSPTQFYNGNPNLKASGVSHQYTPEEITEFQKCYEDPVYFINHYAKVVSLDKGVIPFTLYPYQERIINCVNNNRYTICKLFRQAGKSTTLAVYSLWYSIFHDHKNTVILANKMSTAKDIFSRVGYMYEMLPDFLKPGLVEYNKTSMQFENGSHIRCAPTSASAVRGSSISLLVCDEFAFLSSSLADEFINSVFPTLSSSSESKLVLISTPYGLNHFYKIWTEAKEGKNDFVTVEGKWSEIHDPAWYDQQSKLLGDRVKVAQELDVSFEGSSNTLIDNKTLTTLPAVNPKEEKNGLCVFEEPESNHRYICTVDVSRGRGRDYSAFIIFDATQLPYKVVCTFKNNKITTLEYPLILNTLGKKYNEAVILIENNDLGESVGNALWFDLEYDNLIWTDIKSEVSNSGKTSVVGVRTTHNVKKKGCANIKEIIEHQQLKINDERIIQELKGYVLSKRGIYSAQDTKINDDLCSCLFLMGWLTSQPYFEDLTGINTTQELTKDFLSGIQDYIPSGFKTDGLEEYTKDKYSPLNSDQISLLI